MCRLPWMQGSTASNTQNHHQGILLSPFVALIPSLFTQQRNEKLYAQVRDKNLCYSHGKPLTSTKQLDLIQDTSNYLYRPLPVYVADVDENKMCDGAAARWYGVSNVMGSSIGCHHLHIKEDAFGDVKDDLVIWLILVPHVFGSSFTVFYAIELIVSTQ